QRFRDRRDARGSGNSWEFRGRVGAHRCDRLVRRCQRGGTAAQDLGRRVEGGRRRAQLVDALLAMARETPRMIVGVDFCFSYPAWFVREHGAASATEFWQIVAAHGERWLARECEEARFWGRTGPRRTGKKPAEFRGDAGALRMLRRAD